MKKDVFFVLVPPAVEVGRFQVRFHHIPRLHVFQRGFTEMNAFITG